MLESTLKSTTNKNREEEGEEEQMQYAVVKPGHAV